MADTVTQAVRDLRNELENEMIPELELMLEAARARRAAEQKRRATSFQLAFWITGNTDPLSLDFESLKDDGDVPPTKLDLLKRLGRQFRGTGARVAV